MDGACLLVQLENFLGSHLVMVLRARGCSGHTLAGARDTGKRRPSALPAPSASQGKAQGTALVPIT